MLSSEDTYVCILCFRQIPFDKGGTDGLECDDCWVLFPKWFKKIANWISKLGCLENR